MKRKLECSNNHLEHIRYDKQHISGKRHIAATNHLPVKYARYNPVQLKRYPSSYLSVETKRQCTDYPTIEPLSPRTADILYAISLGYSYRPITNQLISELYN